jgi:hypothetical protein
MNKELENIAKPGRPKGSPNARTQDLFDITERLECNPFEILILFAKGDTETLKVSEISPDLRLRAAKDACDYLFPKRKAVEHSAANSEEGLVAKWLRELDANADRRPINYTEITEEK